MPRLSESLAGRMGILRLRPLGQCEIEHTAPRFIDALFAGRFKTGIGERLGKDLIQRIVAGGYPAALARRTPARRAAWYRDYIETQIQRDVRDLSRIHSLDALPRLLMTAASHTATLINVTDLAAPTELTRQTIRDDITLLERVLLLERLPAWHVNHLSRLVKWPKLHLGDTGIGCALLGVDATTLAQHGTIRGAMLETFVLQELRRQASGRPALASFFHFRDRDDFEVDIVVERGQWVAWVEVKAAASVNERDFRGLRKLKSAAGSRFASGVVLYDGTTTIPFGGGLFAIPIRSLWCAS